MLGRLVGINQHNKLKLLLLRPLCGEKAIKCWRMLSIVFGSVREHHQTTICSPFFIKKPFRGGMTLLLLLSMVVVVVAAATAALVVHLLNNFISSKIPTPTVSVEK